MANWGGNGGRNEDSPEKESATKNGRGKYDTDVKAPATKGRASAENCRDGKDHEVVDTAENASGCGEDDPEVDDTTEKGRDEDDPEANASVDDDDPEVDAPAEDVWNRDSESDAAHRQCQCTIEFPYLFFIQHLEEPDASGYNAYRYVLILILLILLLPFRSGNILMERFSMTEERTWIACWKITFFWIVVAYARLVFRPVVGF